ncbi:hypothetical protein KHDHEBDM_02023 [Pectobacterium polaris]|nr:hypothetical protein KHDHEBDM_02023 [Pectobacterium polaris]
METIKYHGTTICVLDDSDMLTDCTINSYAVIEDSGVHVAVRVGETDAPAIHIDPVPTSTLSMMSSASMSRTDFSNKKGHTRRPYGVNMKLIKNCIYVSVKFKNAIFLDKSIS